MILPRRGATGSSLGLPICFARCLGFGEMVEWACIEFAVGISPSGVPFIEMLESNAIALANADSPSGVPFIEMLEFVRGA